MAESHRIAVIGSTGKGDYGHGLDVCWKDVPNTHVVAVADDDPKGRAAAAKRIGIDQTFADYREMLDRAKPFAVSIAMRWIDRHAEIATACGERGIHAYMEKPFCRTLDECDAVIRAGQMTHAKLALAHITRYSPKLAIARKLVADGAIGKPLEYRGRGKEDRRGGGEDFWVLGSHILNLIATFAGRPQWCFAKLRQAGRNVRKSDVVAGPEGLGPLAGDDVRATYGFADGATATVQSVRNAGGNPSRFALQIFGDKGVLEIGTGYMPEVWILQDPGWSPGRGKKAWRPVSSAGIDKPESVQADGHSGNRAAVLDLLEAVENGREPRCSAADGRATVEMILAAFESARVGSPVDLPLQVVGHPLSAWSK